MRIDKVAIALVVGFILVLNFLAWVIVRQNQPKFSDNLYQFACQTAQSC